MPRATPSRRIIPESLWASVDGFIDDRTDRLVRFRRRIHAMPEPPDQEKETSVLVADSLRERGHEPRLGTGGLGVIVDIDLGAPVDHYVAIRAELDCVNVNDDKQVPYASTRPGLCHACGHDAHSTMALAAAVAIGQAREHLAGVPFQRNIRAIFQPAEETATGARAMIQQGAIERVDAILALHVDPMLDCGVIGIRQGALTSNCKTFRIHVRGRSGHSARPFEALDPIPAATNLVGMLYQLCPRVIDARSPMALTIASIMAGDSHNAIPDQAQILGTLRTTRDEDTDTVQAKMHAVVRAMAEATGCDTEIEFIHHCPATNNDQGLIERFSSVGTELLEPGGVRWLESPSLGAEDFGFYQELIPGAIIRLGTATPDSHHRRPLHSSLFDIDEAALPIGAKLLARCALELAAEPARLG